MKQTKESKPSRTSLKWMWGNLFREKDLSRTTIRETLKKTPLFQDLSAKELSRVQDNLYLRRYRADEFIFREREPGLGMYLILEGSVWIQRTIEPNADTVEPILELKEGDFFSEMALLDEYPHVVSARAHTYTELLGFFRPDFLSLIRYHPRLGTKLLLGLGRVIATRFRSSLPGTDEVESAGRL